MQDTTVSLQLDRSRRDFGHLTSTATPAAESNDAARAESMLRSLNLWWSILPCRPCNYPIRQWMSNDIADMAEPALTTLDGRI